MTEFPLYFAQQGVKLKIVNIKSNDTIFKRLQDLGFVKSAEIVLLDKVGNKCIVKVLESKIALESSLCRKIYVCELSQYEEHKQETLDK